MKRNRDKISLWKRGKLRKIGYYWNPDPTYVGMMLTAEEYALVKDETNHQRGMQLITAYRMRGLPPSLQYQYMEWPEPTTAPRSGWFGAIVGAFR